MKIVIDGRAIKHTGIGRYIEKTVEQILQLDKVTDYVLLVLPKDRPKITLKADNLTLVDANYYWFTFAEQIQGFRLLRQLQADLVHFPNFNFPILYRGQFVMTLHDLTLWDYKNVNASKMLPALYYIKDWVSKRVMSAGMRRARAVLAPSEFVRERIIERFDLPKTKVVRTYEATTTPYSKPRVDLAKFGIEKDFILYVGAAYPHKNLERLILAFGKLGTDYMIDNQLVIAGRKDAFHEQLQSDVHKAGLDTKIIFTDYVSDTELAGLYKAATIYSFPSLSEGFGLPGLEAMSYGLPVAASRVTCLPEIYGEAAVYYDPANVDDMARVMAGLIAHPEEQDKLRSAGYKQVEKFSWEDCAAKTLAVYKKAIKNGPKG